MKQQTTSIKPQCAQCTLERNNSELKQAMRNASVRNAAARSSMRIITNPPQLWTAAHADQLTAAAAKQHTQAAADNIAAVDLT
jgi:uncharacterized protein with ATP-grasp and redox domains